jgi:hypothetical protein
MDVLSSTEFRKRFAGLTEPTVVTANGHPIGYWTPAGTLYSGTVPVVVLQEDEQDRPLNAATFAAMQKPEPKKLVALPKPSESIARMTQAQRDAVLRGATKEKK